MEFRIKLIRRFREIEALIQSDDIVPDWFLGLATLIAVGSIDYAIDQKYIAFQDEQTEMYIRQIFPKTMDGCTDDEIAIKVIEKLKAAIEKNCGPEYFPALVREIESVEESKWL